MGVSASRSSPTATTFRDSPSLAVCDGLVAEGAIVSVHDPVAMPSAAAKRPDLRYAPSVSEAAEAADLVLHLTEWSDYRAIDPAALAGVVARRVIIDARCCLDTGIVEQGRLVRARPGTAGSGIRGDLSPPRGSGGSKGVWGERLPPGAGGLGGRPPWLAVSSTTLASSMARVIGPTPPGMGASHPATAATSAATSPTRPRPSG